MFFPQNTEKSFVETYTNSLFEINSKEMFDKMAVEAFHFQYQNNSIYRNFTDLIHVNHTDVDNTDKIPFLPVELFKNHEIISGNNWYEKVFNSSGTTGSIPSKHFVKDLTLYEKSFREGFRHFYGNIEEYCILALLPSYLEREGS
jgi:hypothetical protein